jgi:hypothetical protein
MGQLPARQNRPKPPPGIVGEQKPADGASWIAERRLDRMDAEYQRCLAPGAGTVPAGRAETGAHGSRTAWRVHIVVGVGLRAGANAASLGWMSGDRWQRSHGG